ncbi:class I SAM-dependent methyltransferase [Modestobacter sp. URMC 112]
MTHTPTHDHLPAMGHRWLLPLYDPLTRLLGAGAAHRRLLDAAGLRPGHRVLEIGCGTGNLTLRAKAGQPDATVAGLDPDEPALAQARRKARRRRLDVRLDQGTAAALPHPDASTDRVLSAFMLHHVPAGDREQALREVHRVLRPGGELHLVDLGGDTAAHHDHGPHRRGRPALHGRRPHATTRAEVTDLLLAAGFADVTATGDTVRFFGPVTYYRAVR